MWACCWALRALWGWVWIVSGSPWLLFKQNTCAWVPSVIKTHRKLVMWKVVEKQERWIEPKTMFASYFSSTWTYTLPEHRRSVLDSQWLPQWVHWKCSWTFFPLAPADYGSKTEPVLCTVFWEWGKAVYSLVVRVVVSFSDEFSEKCVFTKIKIWLMARKILNVWPCQIIFPIPWFQTAEDQGGLLK